MNPKELLDYLCSIGMGHRDSIPVRSDRPNYPNDKSLIQRGTTFYSTRARYTIDIPIVVSDNTRVETRVSLLPSQIAEEEKTLIAKIAVFFESLFKPTTSWQARGIPFTSSFGGGVDAKYNKAHRVEKSVNVDFLLAAMSNVNAGSWAKGDLNIAWFLNYVKDVLSSTGGANKIKTVNPIPNTNGNAKTNGQKEKINNRVRDKIKEYAKIETYEEDTTIVNKVMEYNIWIGTKPYFRGQSSIDGVEIKHWNVPMDTLSSTEVIIRKSGRVDRKQHMIYPSTHVSYEIESAIVKWAYRKWKKLINPIEENE